MSSDNSDETIRGLTQKIADLEHRLRTTSCERDLLSVMLADAERRKSSVGADSPSPSMNDPAVDLASEISKIIYPTARQCNFCARKQADVLKLIAGPSDVYVCDLCVRVFLSYYEGTPPTTLPSDLSISDQSSLGRCSFCRKVAAQTASGKLITGSEVRICDECVDLCMEILNEELFAYEPPLPEDAVPDTTDDGEVLSFEDQVLVILKELSGKLSSIETRLTALEK
jgi:hypothetical protein